MAAVAMAAMKNKKLLLVNSSKPDHAEWIGNYYFGICGKTEKRLSHDPSSPLKAGIEHSITTKTIDLPLRK